MLGRASTGREEEEKHTRRQDCLGVIAEPRALSLPAPWQTPFLWGDRQAGGRAVAGEPGGQSSQDHLIPPTAAAAPGPGARGEHILSCSPCQGRTV